MREIIYLDNAATTWPKPPKVVEAVVNYLNNVGGNPGRSGHSMSIEAARIVFDCRESIAKLFGINDPQKVAFTHNASYALNIVIRGFCQKPLRIVSTMMEHNSVARVLESLKDFGCDILFCPCDKNGFLDFGSFEKALYKKTDLVVINHASNVTGCIQDIKTISKLAKKYGSTLIVDAAQTAGSVPINISELGIDVLAFTGHKGLFGVQGTGGLVFSDNFDYKRIKPVFAAGTGSKSESLTHPDYLPDMLEFGTVNAAGLAGLLAGVEYVNNLGIDNIFECETFFRKMVFDELLHMENISFFGSRENSTGVVSFIIMGKDQSEIGFVLDKKYGVMTRVGLHCAPLAHQTIGTFPTGTVRISPSAMTKTNELKKAIEDIKCLATK